MFTTFFTIGHLILFIYSRRVMTRKKRILERENAALTIDRDKALGELNSIKAALDVD